MAINQNKIGSLLGVTPQAKQTGKVAYPSIERKTYTIKTEQWKEVGTYFFIVCNADSKDGTVKNIADRNQDFDQFVLPINPQNLSISTPFAIATIPTTRGVSEQHSGTIFHNITIKGTTGITPGALRLAPHLVQSGDIYKSAVQSVGSTVAAVGSNTLAQISEARDSFRDLVSGSQSGVAGVSEQWGFGHAQLHQLRSYFISYSEYKRKPENSLARLIFVSTKDNLGYVVTPVAFECQKNSEKPLMWDYSIQLRAWDQVDDVSSAYKKDVQFDYSAYTSDANYLSKAMSYISDARALISASQNAIEATGTDMAKLFSVVNDAMLAVQDLGSLGRSIANFPTMIKDRWNEIAQDIRAKASDIRDTYAGQPSTPKAQNILNSLKELENVSNSTVLSNDATNAAGGPVSGTPNAQRIQDQQRLDINNPFNSTKDTNRHLDLLQEFPLSSFNLSSSEQESINLKIQEVRDFTRSDWEERRRFIEAARDAYADSRGLGDATYDEFAGRTPFVPATPLQPSTTDYLIMKSMNDLLSVFDTFTATNDYTKRQVPDPFVRAQNTVGGTDIVIQKSNSAYPVPFPVNGTLESLAALYLGDADRWIEIVLTNNLKIPYIDETGFLRSFTTSGNKNSFTISDASDLFLGQEVFISSVTRKEERRLIVRIDKLAINNFLITVDGTDDLDQFTTTHLAKMKAYLPNTLNSSKIVWIPFPGFVPPENPNKPDTKDIPAAAQLDQQQKLMGVDIALTDNMDWAVANYGDVKLSVGLANALQAIKLKIAVEQGELQRHPEYGSGINVGERYQLTAEQLKAALESSILTDSRFEDITNITVEFDGPTVSLNLTVRATNGAGVIPISFIV